MKTAVFVLLLCAISCAKEGESGSLDGTKWIAAAGDHVDYFVDGHWKRAYFEETDSCLVKEPFNLAYEFESDTMYTVGGNEYYPTISGQFYLHHSPHVQYFDKLSFCD